jgi:uncharacterized peroxidase-related enzyme
MLAHGALLHKNFFDAEQLALIARDFRNAGLPPEEVAMMALAQKISARASEVNEQDIDELRQYGLSDEEILDVILSSAARNFFSKTLDALNVSPDEIYKQLEPELIQLFTRGRPFS